MTPTIDDILAGLVSGAFTLDQAKPWVAAHLIQAEDTSAASDLRTILAVSAVAGGAFSDCAPAELGGRAVAIADAVLSELRKETPR